MWTILVLLALLTLYFRKRKTKPPQNQPPGPPGLPLIGNLHQFDGRYPHTYLHRLSKQYGPLMSIRLGSRRALVVSSADVVRQIMKSHDLAFSGRPALASLQKLSYNGLDVAFSTYNEIWREMRKVSTLHLFSLKQAQSFRPVREEEVSRMIQKIAGDAASKRVTNLSETMMMLTCNIICRVALGKSIGYEGAEYKRFCNLFNDVQGILTGLFVSDYFPSLGWIDEISGMNARLEKIFRKLDGFYEELIEEHLDYGNRPKSMDGDILDLVLEVRGDGTLSSVDLTMDHIKALLMNIIVGGTDAIAAVVVWALAALFKYPTIMNKVQSEIRQLGNNKHFISENDISNLPYLRAIVKETFRLYPPAPLLVPRETLSKCTINGYEIEPGTLVHINAWAVGRDPEVWAKPNEFSPERFLDSDVDIRGHNPEVVPFGIGRRGCPGMVMGLAATELAMANLLYAFDWELPNGMRGEDIDFDVLPGMTMHKKNALCAVAKPITLV